MPSQRPTRRDLLAAGLAAAGALALGRRAAARQDQGENLYGPFRMGIQSYSLRDFKRDDALARTKELGLKYWESYSAHVPVTDDPKEAGAVQTDVQRHGVELAGFGVVHFGNDDEANRKIFKFAELMGLSYLSCDPDPDSFDSLDRLVAEFKIPVGIHNHGPGHRYEAIDGIAQVIKDRHPLIGCCIDTGHFLRSKEDPVRAVEVFGDRIYGVHLKDVKDAETFTILGRGDLDTVALLRALAKRDYKYCLALEYEENPADPMDDIRACLVATQEAVAKL